MRAREISFALALSALFFISPARDAAAQMDALKNTTPEERARIQDEMMKKKLDLTPDQQPKIASINLKYAQKMEPLLKGSERPLMEFRDMRELNDAKEGELKTVLSPEQFKKYLDSKEEMRAKFEERIKEQSGH